MRDVGHDLRGVLPGHRRAERVVERCACGRAALGLAAGARDELRGVLVARLEPVDELLLALLALLALLLLDALELLRAALALRAVRFLLLFEVLCVLLFALLVELDERGVFFLVGGYASLGLEDVDVVD